MNSEVKTIEGEQISHAYQLFMMYLCLYAIASLGLQTLGNLEPATVQILDYADWVVCGLFLFDFFRSVYRAEDRLRYLYTWGWIDLISSIPMINALRAGRVARLLRIVRVIRALRATKTLVTYFMRHRATSAFYSVLVVAFSLVVFSAIAVGGFERNADGSNIKSAEDALWWAMTTITTVGYGDRFPVTTEGRAIATVLMTAGVGLFGTLSGVIAAWFLAPEEAQRIKATEAEAKSAAEQTHDLDAAVVELRAILAELRENKAARA